MKIKVFFFKFIVFYCFLWLFKDQNFFPGPVLCKYLWHNFKTWKLLSKINFSFDFLAGSWQWRQNYDLFIFQVLLTGASLRPEMNSLGRYMGCFDMLFISERLGWCGVRTWKMNKTYQISKYKKIQIIVTYGCFSSVVVLLFQFEFQMPPKTAKHGGARKNGGRKSKSGEFSNDKTPEEKLKSHR